MSNSAIKEFPVGTIVRHRTRIGEFVVTGAGREDFSVSAVRHGEEDAPCYNLNADKLSLIAEPNDPLLTARLKSPVRPDGQEYKADDGKPNWFLLMSKQGCAKALAGCVRVLSFAVRSKDKGGKGYAPHSWREVPNAKERYEAALYRHLNAIHNGETVDAESGESHWYHIVANAAFLAELHNEE